VFLRVLDAMHESTKPVLSKAHVYSSSANSSGDHLLDNNKTPRKSRKSFFRSLNQLRSEKQLKYHDDGDGKGDEFSDSDEDDEENDEDDDETTSPHDSREQSLKTDIVIKVGSGGVSQQSSGTKLASFYPLMERLAFDLTLKDVCGDWKFSYLPLNIQIQAKVSYATMEEWCLAVLFR
jgi:hypothetical protein